MLGIPNKKYFTRINPFNHDSTTITENYYLHFQNVETLGIERLSNYPPRSHS